MIRSWRNSASRKVWDGERPNQFRGLDFEAAIDLLLALNVAKSLDDLSPLKSVGLHKLKGERKSKWAMTVMHAGASASNFARAMLTKWKSSTTTEVEVHGSHRAPRPSAETRTSRAQAQCQPALARHRRALRAHHRYPQ